MIPVPNGFENEHYRITYDSAHQVREFEYLTFDFPRNIGGREFYHTYRENHTKHPDVFRYSLDRVKGMKKYGTAWSGGFPMFPKCGFTSTFKYNKKTKEFEVTEFKINGWDEWKCEDEAYAKQELAGFINPLEVRTVTNVLLSRHKKTLASFTSNAGKTSPLSIDTYTYHLCLFVRTEKPTDDFGIKINAISNDKEQRGELTFSPKSTSYYKTENFTGYLVYFNAENAKKLQLTIESDDPSIAYMADWYRAWDDPHTDVTLKTEKTDHFFMSTYGPLVVEAFDEGYEITKDDFSVAEGKEAYLRFILTVPLEHDRIVPFLFWDRTWSGMKQRGRLDFQPEMKNYFKSRTEEGYVFDFKLPPGEYDFGFGGCTIGKNFFLLSNKPVDALDIADFLLEEKKVYADGGSCLSGDCISGYCRYANSEGVYEGNFQNSKFHGKGKMTFNNGMLITGSFKEGWLHGYGEISGGGFTQKGTFDLGDAEGNGSISFNNGTRYTGNFNDDLYHGQGKYTFPNGSFFEGTFDKGEFFTGTCYDSNGNDVGSYYQGYFTSKANQNYRAEYKEEKKEYFDFKAYEHNLKNEVHKAFGGWVEKSNATNTDYIIHNRW